MKHLFVPYEIALKLKEKGFNEPCFGAYYQDDKELVPLKWFDNNNLRVDLGKITAPLYQQVIDWFRRKHRLHLEVQSYSNPIKIQGLWYEWAISSESNDYGGFLDNAANRLALKNDEVWVNSLSKYNLCKSYYKALTKAIEEALKLI